MMTNDRIVVEIFWPDYGPNSYAFRQWVQVPNVGDEIMLRVKDDPDKPGFAASFTKKPFKVVRRVFGVEGPDDLSQAVNIEVELIDD